MPPRFERIARDDLLLPGVPRDYEGTSGWEHGSLLENTYNQLLLKSDDIPIPTTAAREGYFGDKHLEYWLSGLNDFYKVTRATQIEAVDGPVILDHGGASGRLMRHFVQRNFKGSKLYLSDSNPNHIRLINHMFNGSVAAIISDGLPPLPLPEASVDLVTMMSVMTHIAEGDVAWLLEFHRILKPGGYIYATIHDHESWRLMAREGSQVWDSFQNTPGFVDYIQANPTLTEPVVQFFSDLESNNCNVFHTWEYIHNVWGRHLEVVSITSLLHATQAGVVLRKRQEPNLDRSARDHWLSQDELKSALDRIHKLGGDALRAEGLTGAATTILEEIVSRSKV